MHPLLYMYSFSLLLRNVEPKARHTTPVLSHEVFAGVLGIAGFGEEHAFVAGRFFLFADAAGLGGPSVLDWRDEWECASFLANLDFGCSFTLGLQIGRCVVWPHCCRKR